MQLGTDERLLQETENGVSIKAKIRSAGISKRPKELAEIVCLFASSDGWLDKVRLQADRRPHKDRRHEAIDVAVGHQSRTARHATT
jgi:hypothetical protein